MHGHVYWSFYNSFPLGCWESFEIDMRVHGFAQAYTDYFDYTTQQLIE